VKSESPPNRTEPTRAKLPPTVTAPCDDTEPDRSAPDSVTLVAVSGAEDVRPAAETTPAETSRLAAVTEPLMAMDVPVMAAVDRRPAAVTPPAELMLAAVAAPAAESHAPATTEPVLTALTVRD